jgi:hypothetical protein
VEASDQILFGGRGKIVELEIRRDLELDVTARMVEECAIHTWLRHEPSRRCKGKTARHRDVLC